MDKTTKSKLLMILFFLVLPSFALRSEWVKIKDEGLMQYIDLTPSTIKEGHVRFSVALDPTFIKEYELYSTGLTAKTDIEYDDWLSVSANKILLPITTSLTKEDTLILDKNMLQILTDGYIDVYYDEKTEPLVHFGWESEEWTLVYYNDVTIGICDTGVWSQFSNCTPSGNWTVQNKTVYANVTSNETFWSINGTIPDYNLIQMWTAIHENAYDISFSFSDYYNYTGINLVSYPLNSEGARSPTESIDFEDGTDEGAPVGWDLGGSTYLVQVSEDVADGDNKSLLIRNDLTDSKPSLQYDTTYNFTVDSTIVHSIYLDKMGVVETVYNYGDTIVSNILTFQIDTSTRIIEWYNQSSASWITGITPLKFKDWSKVHVTLDFTNDLYNIYVDGIFQGLGYFRNYDHNAGSFSKIQIIFNEDANETHLYFDNWEIYNEVYLPYQLDSIANNSYEVLWTTGWAYCTEHANCTSPYYCTLSGDENSKCTLDVEGTLSLENLQTIYPEGEATFFASYEDAGTPIVGANVWFELYNASVNGTLLGNVSATYSNDLYQALFNITEFEGYYIEVHSEYQPVYASEIDSDIFDSVIAQLIIEYPLSTDEVSAKTLYPQFKVIISDFVRTAECSYETALQKSDKFTVSNNVTYSGTFINPINGENYLIVSCKIGELTLIEQSYYTALVIPDVYLLGINTEAHLLSQLYIFYFKRFLWTVGKPLFGFFIIIGFIITMFNNLFIRGVQYISGRSK